MILYDFLLKLLILSYAGVGVVSVIGYWPTIKDLYFHKKKSANTHSYVIWTLSGGIAFLYAVFILDDWLVRAVSGLNFLCCAIILVLSLRLKK